MTLKLKYITHNHSVCLLAYHFVTTTKKRRNKLDDVTLDLFRLALKKYPITIHIGEIMPDHIYPLIQAPSIFASADRHFHAETKYAKKEKANSQLLFVSSSAKVIRLVSHYYLPYLLGVNLNYFILRTIPPGYHCKFP